MILPVPDGLTWAEVDAAIAEADARIARRMPAFLAAVDDGTIPAETIEDGIGELFEYRALKEALELGRLDIMAGVDAPE